MDENPVRVSKDHDARHRRFIGSETVGLSESDPAGAMLNISNVRRGM
jgi:hypothetical protein